MPNWVCNHLIIHGENAVEVMNSLLSENSESENGCDIDFNKIIPMPEDLKIESGSVTRDCAKLYVNAMLEGCDAYKKYAALYVQAFGKDLAMSEDEQRKTMEYVMLHKDYEKNCPMFQTKADAYAYGKKALELRKVRGERLVRLEYPKLGNEMERARYDCQRSGRSERLFSYRVERAAPVPRSSFPKVSRTYF